jgi:hypothetical protein
MEYSFSPLSRRQMLQTTGCGFGLLALQSLLQGRAYGTSPSESDAPLHPAVFNVMPKVKRVIFLFMQGGVSQVDSFDPKSKLQEYSGQKVPFDDARVIANTGKRGTPQRVFSSPWKFKPYGECGLPVSDLFPHIGQQADDLCVIRSMNTEGVAHGPATLFLHCGATVGFRPSMGSWISYGLGTENENLPAFITISPSAGNGGPRNYGSAFLPAKYQGTGIGKTVNVKQLNHIDLLQSNLSDVERLQKKFALLQSMNRLHQQQAPTDDEIEAVVESYETAWKMQHTAPEVLDLEKEDAGTLQLYGIGEKATDRFGRQCLLARRLCEAGVRFIQVTYGDDTANPAWDQHSNLEKHADHALATDRPVAALLQDLKRRGLLEDTLVWWGGEFGRTPYAQDNGTGRDHNPGGFTVWLAGGGVKPGITYGATDEFGHTAIENRVHMHDLHATLLHLMGLDHLKLTYRYAGRDYRLTDVHGKIITGICS